MQANVCFREQLAALGAPPLEGAVPSLFIAFLKSDKLVNSVGDTRDATSRLFDENNGSQGRMRGGCGNMLHDP